MSNRKAALTGVLYYLLEESRNFSIGVNGNCSRASTLAWRLRSRDLSARLNRAVQSRRFRQPFGIHRQFQAGTSRIHMEPGKIDKIPELQFRMFSRLAGKRSLNSRNHWKARS